MKRSSIVLTMLFALTLVPKLSLGRGHTDTDGVFHKPRLSRVTLEGTLQCEKDNSNHQNRDCRLQFTNSENGEVWNVQEHPALAKISVEHDKPLRIRFEGFSSPRYLLGGSYIEIRKIKMLDSNMPEWIEFADISSNPTVKWRGIVTDEPSSHTTEHAHSLQFTRLDTGEQYGIESSPELVKLHCENEKNYVAEIEAELTPRFLFWGGNLVVKKFTVIGKDESQSISHYKAQDVKVEMDRPRR